MNRRSLAVAAVLAVIGVGAGFGASGHFSGSAGATADTTTDSTATANPEPTASATSTETEIPKLVEITTSDGEALRLETAANQVVRGTTRLSPGTNLTLRLQSTNSSSPFLATTETTVDQDGGFEVTFDLSNVAETAAFRAVVRHDGEIVAAVNGTVVATSSASTTRTPEADDPAARFETGPDGMIAMEAVPDQVVRGTTDLPAGTEVAVRMRSTDSEQPFLKSAETTVTEDGSFTATFNMSGVQAGSTFHASVRYNGTRVADAEGTVAEPE